MHDVWNYEKEYTEKGYQFICGVDEAGAGPLAGPVCAAAVIMPIGVELKWLDDSKKVTDKRRDVLFDQIKEVAIAWVVETVDVEIIEEINILAARMLAMDRAINALKTQADFALIDGNYDKGITCPHITIVKGDSASASIAAASILAKVTRDRYMIEMDGRYPEYEFHRHKGYGTKLHYEHLREFGPCPIHRPSFLKKLR